VSESERLAASTGGVSADRDGDRGKNDGDRGNDDGKGRGPRHITILDDCDPTDAGWEPTGGCLLKSGDVTVAEFDALLASSLSLSVVGHPAWRNQPSYLEVRAGETIKVENDGGRLHTFTKVAAFGGGRIPPLNIGLTPAPECALAAGAADPAAVAPGKRLELSGLAAGIHRYECCIHPWMRALIRVSAKTDRG
jgi:plastocyanin